MFIKEVMVQIINILLIFRFVHNNSYALFMFTCALLIKDHGHVTSFEPHGIAVCFCINDICLQNSDSLLCYNMFSIENSLSVNLLLIC